MAKTIVFVIAAISFVVGIGFEVVATWLPDNNAELLNNYYNTGWLFIFVAFVLSVVGLIMQIAED